MRSRSAEVRSAALAAFAAASVWVSLGTMMVLDARTLARAVALPPLWLLGAMAAAGAVVSVRLRWPPSRLWPLALTVLLWLPYLPSRVPAAFLIWDGPIEGLVWTAVAAGLLAPRVGAWLAHVGGGAVGDPRRAPWVAGLVAALCASLGFRAIEGLIPGGDEPHYLVITQSLLFDGDLRIENNHQRRDYWPYIQRDLKPDYLVRGQDGDIYPIHPPGVSVMVLPAFAAWGYHGAVATVIAATALAGALTWRTAWLLSGTAGGAWFAWAAVFLTAPYFFQEFTIFPDGAGGLLVAVGLWGVVRAATGRPPGPIGWAAAGGALAALPWFHTRFAVLAAALGLALALRARASEASPQTIERAPKRLRLVAFLLPPVVSAALWLTYFQVIWGTPNPAAPYGAFTNTSLSYMVRGIPGLLFDQQFGLVAAAPVYAVAALGWLALARRRVRLALELVAIAVPYVAAAASYGMWWGGESAPARFIAALLPAAALPLAWWWREHSAPGWRAFALALLLVSLLAVVPKLVVDGGTMIYNARDGVDLLLDWLAKSVDLPMAFPSLHRDAPALAWRDAAVWAASGLAVAGLAWGIGRRPMLGAERTWTLTVAGFAAASMAAAAIVWARNEMGVTPTRSQAAALDAWRPDWQTTTVHLRPWRSLTRETFARAIELGSTARAARQPGAPTLFRASWLPAADYDVVTTGASRLSGELTVLIGRTELPSERWRLEGRQEGYTGHVLRLPVPVYSVTVRGDGGAVGSIADLRLRVNALRTGAPTRGRYARRAARFGASRMFAMDDHLYLEPGGFWTRAEAVTEIVIDTDDPGRPTALWLQTGPVATTAVVSDGSWSERVGMGPLERRPVALPPRAGRDAWVLTIASGAGFRPNEHDPKSEDTRHLGVWIELR
jgi:hypothetical protein